MRNFFIFLIVLPLMSACVVDSKAQLMQTGAGAVELRSMQTRVYETQDKQKLLRTALATLQDLGFVIDKADEALGSVSATKLDGYALRMTINIRKKGTKEMVVRANGEYQNQAVIDPEPYQQFFDAYSKALFLEEHQL